MEINNKRPITKEDMHRIEEILRPDEECRNIPSYYGTQSESPFSISDTFDEASPKPERVVFSFGIGKGCDYKTPAQAFVEKLRSFETDMALAKIGVLDEQKVIEEHQAFLNGGYKKELSEGESAEEMLTEAIKYSQAQQEKYIAEAQKMEEGINKDESFVSISGKPYSDSVNRDIAASYEKVSGQVAELMSPAETQV